MALLNNCLDSVAVRACSHMCLRMRKFGYPSIHTRKQIGLDSMPPTELSVSGKAYLKITHSFFGWRPRSSAANPVSYIFYSQHKSRFYLVHRVGCKDPRSHSNSLHTSYCNLPSPVFSTYFFPIVAKVGQVTVFLY